MPADPSTPRAGDRLVAVGAALFGVGVLATVVTVVPFLLDLTRLPTAFYLLSMLAPLGLGIALLGILRNARSRRRPRQR